MTRRFSLVLSLAVLGGMCFNSGAAHADTYNVQPTGCDDSTCLPCCTIQAAVDHCGPGDTVAVHTGDYVENVVLSTMGNLGSITLMAADGPGTVTLTSNDNPAIQCWWAHPGDIHIEGFTVSALVAAGLWLHAEGDVTVIDVTVTAVGLDGFQVHSQADVLMNNCVANGTGENGIEIHARGDVRLEGCTANNNPNGGIWVDEYTESAPISGPTNVTVVACQAHDNGTLGVNWRDGVKTSGVDGVVEVTRTETNGNSGDGLKIEAHDGITVRGCEARNNGLGPGLANSGFDMIMTDVGPVAVSGSTMDGNGKHGIEIQAGHTWDIVDLWIQYSSITNNADSGIDLSDMSGDGHLVNWTEVAGNGVDGLVLHSNVYLHAENNWWGDPSGPSGDGPGGGDTVDQGPGVVYFDPWLPLPVGEIPGSPVYDDPFETGGTDGWDVTVGLQG